MTATRFSPFMGMCYLGSACSLHDERKLLTISEFERMPIRIPQKCPISHGRSAVFGLPHEPPLRTRNRAQLIDLVP